MKVFIDLFLQNICCLISHIWFLGSPFAHLFKKVETVLMGYQGFFCFLFLFFLSFSFLSLCYPSYPLFFPVDFDDDEEDLEQAKHNLKMGMGSHRS